MINTYWIGTIAILLVITLLMLLISFIQYYRYVKTKQELHEHLGEKGGDKKKEKLRERLWRPILQFGERLGPLAMNSSLFRKDEEIEKLLRLAGNPLGMTLQLFYGIRWALFFIGLGIGWIWFMLGMPLANFFFIGSPIFGFFFPNIWLKNQAKSRQLQISLTMPEFLDTIGIALHAGASLDGALHHVSKNADGPLEEEIQRLLQELNLGVPRRKAYENMLNRNNAKELEELINSLIQGSELGVSVAVTFQQLAEELRVTRGFRAKEQAGKAGPKITLVTTFIITPSIFMLIIGLLVLNFVYQPEMFGLDRILG